ncbi:ROK family protein [Microbacterium sp. SLBN-146]|uniref:ROK family protein n=1 Tax=Microbacterium sp. SLBN-146 TaxID=2768457 RepID=UPI001154267E|nr:ROK family protein [Microbacterium sp. SLBN-146]TQJ30450.1 glucokinase [Microbacterium sp. SLBN-146]
MRVAIAIDLGGTKVEAAVVDGCGAVVEGSRARSETGPRSDHTSLGRAITSVLDHAARHVPRGATVEGVGVGSAGPLDAVRGTVSPLNMPRARTFPIVDVVRATLPDNLAAGRVELALDGLCIALAEHWLGAGRDNDTMLGMVVSTGIGGGIITRSGPILGGTGNGGHIGQIEVAGFTPAGVHGLDATVERIASGPNIVRWARAQGWTGQTGTDLGASYAAGDLIAVRAVRRSAAAVGAAVASAAALLDIDVVVIGGGFAGVSSDYIDLVREARDSSAAYPFLSRSQIFRARLGRDSPLVGAAKLVL